MKIFTAVIIALSLAVIQSPAGDGEQGLTPEENEERLLMGMEETFKNVQADKAEGASSTVKGEYLRGKRELEQADGQRRRGEKILQQRYKAVETKMKKKESARKSKTKKLRPIPHYKGYTHKGP